MPKKKITDPKASNAITLLSGNRLPIDLTDGLTIGSDTYKIAVLRQLNAGDVQEASEASERLVFHSHRGFRSRIQSCPYGARNVAPSGCAPGGRQRRHI